MRLTDPTLKGPFALIFRSGPVPVVFPFSLAPQHFQVEFPSRITVHQTLDANFVDDFSGPRSVLATAVLRGTFGYQAGRPIGTFGSLTMKTLEVLVETFNAIDRALKTQLNLVTEFLALSRLYYWRVVIDRLVCTIDERNPLLYFYELRLRRIEDVLSPTNLLAKGVGFVAAHASDIAAVF